MRTEKGNGSAVHKVCSLALAVSLLALAPSRGDQPASQTESAPLLEIASVMVEPYEPGPDTLCKLRLKLRNNGSRKASQLAFAVTVNDAELIVYRNQIFMYLLEPDQETEVSLYNFWSTETSRPEPASGKLEITVQLLEGQWMEITTEDDTETWSPLGPVQGLPIAHTVTLSMASE